MASSEELKVKVVLHGAIWSHVEKGEVSISEKGNCQVCDLGAMLFFQIGAVNYALKSGMPVVSQEKDDRVVFIFTSKKANTHYGLSAPNNEESQELLKLLKQKMYIEEPSEEEKKQEEKAESSKVAKYGNKLASVISKGGKIGLKGIDKGTAATKKGLESLTEKAKKKIKAREKPMEVSDKTKQRVQKATTASKMAVQVSGAVLKGAMETANQLSDQYAPMLKDALEKKGLKTDQPAGPKTAAAKDVGKQSVKAALEMYLAMKEAAVVLTGAVMDASAELVEARYGADAGGVAKDATAAGKNALKAASNVGGFGMKAVAKKIAADTVLKSIDDPADKALKKDAAKAAAVLVAAPQADPENAKPDVKIHTKKAGALDMD